MQNTYLLPYKMGKLLVKPCVLKLGKINLEIYIWIIQITYILRPSSSEYIYRIALLSRISLGGRLVKEEVQSVASRPVALGEGSAMTLHVGIIGGLLFTNKLISRCQADTVVKVIGFSVPHFTRGKWDANIYLRSKHKWF